MDTPKVGKNRFLFAPVRVAARAVKAQIELEVESDRQRLAAATVTESAEALYREFIIEHGMASLDLNLQHNILLERQVIAQERIADLLSSLVNPIPDQPSVLNVRVQGSVSNG